MGVFMRTDCLPLGSSLGFVIQAAEELLHGHFRHTGVEQWRDLSC
jgi:hypothetical protein